MVAWHADVKSDYTYLDSLEGSVVSDLLYGQTASSSNNDIKIWAAGSDQYYYSFQVDGVAVFFFYRLF